MNFLFWSLLLFLMIVSNIMIFPALFIMVSKLFKGKVALWIRRSLLLLVFIPGSSVVIFILLLIFLLPDLIGQGSKKICEIWKGE